MTFCLLSMRKTWRRRFDDRARLPVAARNREAREFFFRSLIRERGSASRDPIGRQIGTQSRPARTLRTTSRVHPSPQQQRRFERAAAANRCPAPCRLQCLAMALSLGGNVAVGTPFHCLRVVRPRAESATPHGVCCWSCSAMRDSQVIVSKRVARMARAQSAGRRPREKWPSHGADSLVAVRYSSPVTRAPPECKPHGKTGERTDDSGDPAG